MEMSVDSFKEWLEKDCKWHWDMNIDENGFLMASVAFDSSFPTLGGGYTWAADAWFIAPSFDKKRVVRGIDRGHVHKGGYFALQTPRWYPLPDSGWKILGTFRNENLARPWPGKLSEGGGNSISWKPYGDVEKLALIIYDYATNYSRKVISAYDFFDSGFDVSIPDADRYRLSERGEIRRQSLDIYLSVGISFIVRNGGTSKCVARLFGVPKHFVSKDLL